MSKVFVNAANLFASLFWLQEIWMPSPSRRRMPPLPF